jgi:hypothetical protein
MPLGLVVVLIIEIELSHHGAMLALLDTYQRSEDMATAGV